MSMDDNRSRRSSGEDTNPFSFVSFLKQQNTEDEDIPFEPNKENPDSDHGNSASDNNSNPFSFHNVVKLKPAKMFPKLPTLSTDSEDESNTHPARNLDNIPEARVKRRSLLIMEDPLTDVQLPQPRDLEILSTNEPFGVPVFADEDTIGNLVTEQLQDAHLMNKLHDSQAKISTLHEQVEEDQRIILQRDIRIQELEAELKKQKVREAEDTATLEKMMHSIEKNLKLTTERAVTAETQVSTLKQEMKVLQAHVVSLEMQLAASLPEDEVSMRAQNIAQKLNTAVNQAETSLKDLLNGVGQLRLLSSVVGSITKVTEPS